MCIRLSSQGLIAIHPYVLGCPFCIVRVLDRVRKVTKALVSLDYVFGVSEVNGHQSHQSHAHSVLDQTHIIL